MEVIMVRFASFIMALLFTSGVFACTEPGTGFLPENNLSIPVSDKSSGLTEERFNAVIDKVLRVYRPIVHDYGGILQVNRKWTSEVVNAGTYRDDKRPNLWIINLYGGFARHPYISEDGYALVICHEIGHHIGGAPKKIIKDMPIWASTEGQSDYFATLKCLRKVFVSDDNIDVVSKLEVPEKVKEDCEKSFPTDWEVALCIRTSLAGLSVAKVNADSRKVDPPEFTTPDQTLVEATSNNHPVPQCRLDTYFAGSVCEVPSTYYVSQKDEVQGTCHRKNKMLTGLRPGCWFRPTE
jgi:hypothetical protein